MMPSASADPKNVQEYVSRIVDISTLGTVKQVGLENAKHESKEFSSTSYLLPQGLGTNHKIDASELSMLVFALIL